MPRRKVNLRKGYVNSITRFGLPGPMREEQAHENVREQQESSSKIVPKTASGLQGE
eukprot:CAMPEP_0170167438 /NCGR_PEP_ID=MMETSP0040_2-20121228/838_1 /TAXON_ID=641309 /ORGANISM="Lotharella oceanica, Strain CCMP622" /LENGTH=55 /DNA_ID=CAMNT_0010405459 /DNA_START=4525 /DNA_END=4692 /DNA_ORIENTATION=-